LGTSCFDESTGNMIPSCGIYVEPNN
jgi:hypothetical protein